MNWCSYDFFDIILKIIYISLKGTFVDDTILIPDTTHTHKIVELWLLIALKTAPICSFMCIKISRYLDYHYVYLFFCWSIRQIKIFQYWRSDKIIFVDWKCKGTSGKPSVKFFMGIPLFLPDPNWQLTIDSSQYRKFAFYNEGTSMLVDL